MFSAHHPITDMRLDFLSPAIVGLSDRVAPSAASKRLSNQGDTSRRPATTLLAHPMYSNRRSIDQSAAGLNAMLRRLLVLSASLISLASPPSRYRSSVGGHVTRLTRPRSTSTTKPAENTAVPKSAHSNNAWRCASSRCETTFRIVRSSIRKTLSGPAGSFRKAFERALTQQTFRGDVPVLYFGRERRLNPDGFGLLNRFGQFGFWAHHGILSLLGILGMID
jgi:hypothetical protein